MEILKRLIGKSGSKKNQSELDAAVDAIAALMERHAEAVVGLNAARASLEKQMESEIVDGAKPVDADKGATAIIAAKARVDSLVNLIVKARAEAVSLIGAGRGGRAAEVLEIEKQLKTALENQGRRKAQAIAEFAAKHGLTVKWPTEHMGGAITVPTLGIDAAELEAIAQEARGTAPAPDPDQDRIDRLRGKKAEYSSLDSQDPGTALDFLLSRAGSKS
jgi:hypothetical protein